jgi:hypothetical protein
MNFNSFGDNMQEKIEMIGNQNWRINFNMDYAIHKPLQKIYPLSAGDINDILNGFGLDKKDMIELPISNRVMEYSDSSKEKHPFGVIIFTDGKAVKYSTIRDLLPNVRSEAFIIIVPYYSKLCLNVIELYAKTNEKSIALKNIRFFMSDDQKSTAGPMLGRFVAPAFGKPTDKKQSITIQVPAKGFPELGERFDGNLTAKDIYAILEMKGLKSDKFKEKGFDLFVASFTKLLEILNDKGKITVNQWNTILEETGLFTHLEKGEK